MCSLSPAYRFQYPAKYTNFKYHQISFERCTGGIPNPLRTSHLLWTRPRINWKSPPHPLVKDKFRDFSFECLFLCKLRGHGLTGLGQELLTHCSLWPGHHCPCLSLLVMEVWCVRGEMGGDQRGLPDVREGDRGAEPAWFTQVLTVSTQPPLPASCNPPSHLLHCTAAAYGEHTHQDSYKDLF